MLAESVVHEFGGKVRFVVENYGSSELARRFGLAGYPVVFVDDVLVAKPKDFGFFGKGQGSGAGRYSPWKEPRSHELFRTDLKKMVEFALAGNRQAIQKSVEEGEANQSPEVLSLPKIMVTDLAGRTVSGEELAGRVVLVEFWATWCPPCRGTLGWLGKLKERYGDRLVVLALALESDEEEVRKVAKNLNLPLRWAIGNGDLARSFGDIYGFPTLFLFDSSGKRVSVYYGAPPDLHPKAEKALELLFQ